LKEGGEKKRPGAVLGEGEQAYVGGRLLSRLSTKKKKKKVKLAGHCTEQQNNLNSRTEKPEELINRRRFRRFIGWPGLFWVKRKSYPNHI